MSHSVPIRSNPANTPSDTYKNCLMKGDDSSNRLTFPAGFCSVNLSQKRTYTYDPDLKFTKFMEDIRTEYGSEIKLNILLYEV